MRALWQDLRFGARVLGRTPAWTTLAVTMLAFGIGGSATAFSLAHALFWQRLPVQDPSRLVHVHQTLAWRPDDAGFELSYPDYVYYRDHSHAVASLAAHYSTSPLHVRADAGVWDVTGSVVTANYFETLGIEPALGRVFAPHEDAVRDTHRVAIISHDFWRQEFSASGDVLRQSLSINGEPFTIVGVAPRGFRGVVPGVPPSDVWIPSAMFRVGYRSCDAFTRACRVVQMLGRLAPGSDVASAQAEFDVLAGQLSTAFPEINKGRGIQVRPARGVRIQEQSLHRTGAALLAGAAALVLIIACGNLAGLLLARGISRRKEIAVRLALGGSRARIVRQLLTEGLLLALAGAVAGVLVAVWGTELLRTFYGVSYVGTNLNLDLRLNPTVLAFMLVLASSTTVFFGLVPALRSSRADVLPSLKHDARTILGHGSSGRDLLVVAQIALAVVLLTGASLLVRSARYLHEGPGYDATRIALFRVRPALVGFVRANARRFQERVIQTLEATPGVASASPAVYPPLPRWGPDVAVSWPDGDVAAGSVLQARQNIIGPRYFETLGVKPLQGREFAGGDRTGDQPLVVVNETLERRLWNDGDAIGRFMTVGGARYQVIGVVPDAQYVGPAEPPKPFVYFNHSQRESAQGDTHILVRTRGDVLALLPPLREAITTIDRDVPISGQRLSDRVAWEFGTIRAMRAALVSFGAVGTLLSAIGLYGLLAFTVNLRARELAIRVALGALPRDLVGQLAARSMTLMIVGVGVGLTGASASARLIQSLLYGVSGVDLTTMTTVAVALALVALLASYAPARRVARLDPASVFRAD